MNTKSNVSIWRCLLALFLPLAVLGQATNLSTIRLPTSAVLASNSAVKLKFDAQGALYLSAQANDGSLYSAKYATNGGLVWSQQLGGSLVGGVPEAACLDAAGNYYVTAAAATDWATLKFGPDGTPAWTNRINGVGNRTDTPAAITVDLEGNSYVAGNTSVSGHPGYFTYENFAITVVSYTPSGVQRWRTDYYGNWYRQAQSVVADELGHVFVSGATQLTQAHQIGNVILSLSSASGGYSSRRPGVGRRWVRAGRSRGSSRPAR